MCKEVLHQACELAHAEALRFGLERRARLHPEMFINRRFHGVLQGALLWVFRGKQLPGHADVLRVLRSY